MNIPESIRRRIGGRTFKPEDIGHSGATVLMFEDMVLKVQPESNMAANEVSIMNWANGKLAVPQIIETEVADGTRFTLMSRMQGHYLCTEPMLDDQERLAEICAESLKRLWTVDIAGCPTDRTLDAKFREIEAGLKEGRFRVEDSMQPEIYQGPDGFRDPAALFDWLVEHRPGEELRLTHGDLCLPNIFAGDRGFTGYIDVGLAGVADRWVDIEKCLWSMWANTTGFFGGKRRPFERKLLFDALGMAPDEERLRYYGLLDELC